jgi:CRISPR/Cas system-associated endonuclease Cas1
MISGIEKPWLGCVEKMKEICSLVLDQMKMIKEIHVKCQALHLARHGYEQEKLSKENDD